MKRLVAGVISASLLGMLLFTPTAAYAAQCGTVGAVAHRGGDEHFTEDTRHAFRDATDIGVNFWENDVRFTSDEVPIIMHDETVDRTTNGTGQVADLTWAQIAAMRTNDGQQVPTLWDFINDQSFADAYAFVEIKSSPTEAQWAAFVAAVKSRTGWGGPKPVITSFDAATLDQVAVRLPGYTRGLIRSAGDFDPATVTPHASIVLVHHDSITVTRLQKWTTAGLKVYAWADPNADPQSEWVRINSYSTDAVAGSVSGYVTSKISAYLIWQKSCVAKGKHA